MKYAKIIKCDITNGPGFRTVLFTQGCPHHCPECFNPETWGYEGKDFAKKEEDILIELCKNEHCAGLSLLGGEPLLERNLEALEHLLDRFHKECPDKTVWLWTGYRIEELSTQQRCVAMHCNTIIDGPFVKEKKDLSLFYAGSSNQRLWDVLPSGILAERKMPSINDCKSCQ